MKKNIKLIVIIASLALLLGGGYLLYQKFYGGASNLSVIEFPNVSFDYPSLASDQGIVSDYLWMRTKQLMTGKDGDTLMIPSSYTIAGRLSYQEAQSSGEYDLSDQGLLLMMYVINGDRLNAMRLKDEVLSYYDFELESNEDLSSWIDSYLYYTASFGSSADLTRISELCSILFDEEGNMRTEQLSVAVYDQGGFFSTDDIGDGSLSTLEQGTNRELTEFTSVEGIVIESVDLRLIRNLETNGFLPQGSFDRNLELVTGAKVSESLPLYAYAYVDGIYIYSHDVAAAVDVCSSVATMRHLSEVGALPEDSVNWLRNQVINAGAVYSEYYYAQGSTDGEEALDIYPDIMHIGLNTDDMDLYRSAAVMEGIRVATYSNSPALSMIFRQEGGRFVFYADENLDVCLAVT